jgi:predicted metalloprotease with PDZ domain
MPHTKKNGMPRNGPRRAGTTTTKRTQTKSRGKSDSAPLLDVTVRSEGLEQFREAQEQIGEITRQARAAQKELVEVVRQAKEARQELASLREATREGRRPAAEESTKRTGRKGRERIEERRVEPRNRLGVTVGSGVVVADVLPDTPAAKAGVTRGDVIEVVNDTPIVSAAQLRDAVHKADTDVTLRIVRAGKPRDIKAPLGAEKPEEKGKSNQNRFGVTVGPGVVVAEVLADTPAARAGLERGDVIDNLNGTPVLSGEQLRDVVQQLPAGGEATVHVTRAGTSKEIKARLNGTDGSR